MLGNFPPFTTMQELNLDWILTKIKNILRFVPDDGAVGQILRRTRSGAEWSDEQGAGGSVTSVNGMQGAVVLDAADVGALPDTTPIPTNTSDLNNDSGFVDAAGAAAASPVQSVNGQTGTVSLDASDVGALPDSYVAPVTSVNGQTGAVSLTIPDSTSDLVNDAGFVNAAGAAAAAPVQSVNGQTGAVSLTIPDLTPVTDVATHNSYIQTSEVVKSGYVKILNVSISSNNTLIPQAYTQVATLPAGFYPSQVTRQVFIDGDGHKYIVQLSTTGEVNIYNYTTSHISAAFSIAYI